jgi:hypothetical protein
MSATQMKTTLLATVLALPACAANADSLPDAYLGRWCSDGGNAYESVETEQEWKTCFDSDNHLEIKRDGWIRREQSCKFISIKHIKEKIPPEDDIGRDIWKGNWRPATRIVARCTGDNDGPWKATMMLRWIRGGGIYISDDEKR